MRKLSLMLLAVLGFGASVAFGQEQKSELTLNAGDKAPAFKATNTKGEEITLDSFKNSDVVVVVFTCNSCPVAVAYEDRLIALANTFKDKKVTLVAINNSKNEDLEAMKTRAREKGFNFVYAYEGTGESARAYGAKVTPHCFVLNSNREVVYQGAFDNAQTDPTEHFVADAVASTLNGEKVEVNFKKAFGCGIKFRNP